MKKNRGMTLLLSLLMLSMVLATSLSVSYLIITGIKLSETVEQSQLAYYAADSSIECALYVDLKLQKFGQGNPTNDVEGACSGVVGGSVQKIPDQSSPWSNGAIFKVDYINGACSEVTVDKRTGTVITAVSFNDCRPSTPRKVNRSLEISY
ncbi:MAG: hypothetical protein HZC14_03185 [Candidatus Niyogibacteria bacterium]|nr:hypothetical protein [Candidatus Niyogibacteria bacterium]